MIYHYSGLDAWLHNTKLYVTLASGSHCDHLNCHTINDQNWTRAKVWKWVVFDQKLDGWKAWEQGYNHPLSTPFHKKQQEVASFPDSVEEPENEGITQ